MIRPYKLLTLCKTDTHFTPLKQSVRLTHTSHHSNSLCVNAQPAKLACPLPIPKCHWWWSIINHSRIISIKHGEISSTYYIYNKHKFAQWSAILQNTHAKKHNSTRDTDCRYNLKCIRQSVVTQHIRPQWPSNQPAPLQQQTDLCCQLCSEKQTDNAQFVNILDHFP